MSNVYDVIVIGIGGMGSAVCQYASQAGLRVLGLEQFKIGHPYGSSHGQTRAIRKAYFEKPDYVPLCNRAIELWQNIEAQSQKQLLNLCGVAMYLPHAEGKIKDGLLQSASQYNIPIESLTIQEASKRWPLFHAEDNSEIFHEPEAGYLHVESCVRTMSKLAKSKGAHLLENTAVTDWQSNNNSVFVKTKLNTYTAKYLVITGGAWNTELLKSLNLRLSVHEVLTGWYPPQKHIMLGHDAAPVWLTELDNEIYYGFPMLDPRGMKIAKHTPGKRISNLSHITRTHSESEEIELGRHASRFIPTLSYIPTETQTCLYTMTPDEDFIVDRFPNTEHVIFAAGFSGHGFKFAPVMGEHITALITQSAQQVDCSFLKLRKSVVREQSKTHVLPSPSV